MYNIHTTDYITHNIYIGFTFQKHLKGQKEMYVMYSHFLAKLGGTKCFPMFSTLSIYHKKPTILKTAKNYCKRFYLLQYFFSCRKILIHEVK